MTDSVENKEEELKETEPVKKNKLKKRAIIFGILAFILFVIWLGLQPLRAGVNYGICRTYIEGTLKYPTTFRIVQYDEFGDSLRIFYTYTDEYGGRRSKMIECVIKADDVGGYSIDDIKIDRKSIAPKDLAQFIHTIPGILKGEPDLVIPRPTTEDFNDLKRD